MVPPAEPSWAARGSSPLERVVAQLESLVLGLELAEAVGQRLQFGPHLIVH